MAQRLDKAGLTEHLDGQCGARGIHFLVWCVAFDVREDCGVGTSLCVDMPEPVAQHSEEYISSPLGLLTLLALPGSVMKNKHWLDKVQDQRPFYVCGSRRFLPQDMRSGDRHGDCVLRTVPCSQSRVAWADGDGSVPTYTRRLFGWMHGFANGGGHWRKPLPFGLLLGFHSIKYLIRKVGTALLGVDTTPLDPNFRQFKGQLFG